MLKRITASLVIVLASHVSGAELDWAPAQTRVFIVGILEWKGDALQSFPKKGRRDSELAEVFKQRGVPEKNITLIQDAKATTAAVRAAFDAFLKTTEKNDTLFVYYCGHGYGSEEGDVCFATFDASGSKNDGAWAVPAIFDAVEKQFAGARVIFLADCCCSGGLADVAQKRKSSIQYAALASVLSTESSTGCWTFSDSFLDALRGAPQVDLNSDGVVTFDEAARYSRGEMDFFDAQTASSGTGNAFKPMWRLAAAENKKSNSRVGEYVEVLRKNGSERARIDDFKDGKFSVRFASPAERRSEWVAEDQVQTVKAEPAPVPGARLAAGAQVKVEWKKRWWPARILKIEEKAAPYFITYDGYGEDWNEWVAPERVRARR